MRSFTAGFALIALLLAAATVHACRLEPSRLRGDLTIADAVMHFTNAGQVVLPSASFGGSGFTIMVDVNTVTGTGALYSAGEAGTSNYIELKLDDTKIVLTIGSETASSFRVLQTNQWQHIAVSVDNNSKEVKMFVDATEVQVDSGSPLANGVLVSARSGLLGRSRADDSSFEGYMDNFILLNAVVAETDVEWAHKQLIPFIHTDNLVMYFPFNDLTAGADGITSGHAGSSAVAYMNAEVSEGPVAAFKAEINPEQVVDSFCAHNGVAMKSDGNNIDNLPPFFNQAEAGYTELVHCAYNNEADTFDINLKWEPEGGISSISIRTSENHYWRITAPGLQVEHRTWGGWNVLPRGADIIRSDWTTYKFTDDAVLMQAANRGYIKITEQNGLLNYDLGLNTAECPVIEGRSSPCDLGVLEAHEFAFSQDPIPEMPLGQNSMEPGVAGKPAVLACPTPSPSYRPSHYRQIFKDRHGYFPGEQCVMGSWSSYSACSKTCGGGRQTRTRNVAKKGENCGSTSETRSCNTHPCPVHCAVSAWSRWSACSETCDDGRGQKGTKTRSRTVTQQPMYGGRACPSLNDSAECNRHVCPVDCEVGAWGAFGACSVTCGGGTHSRTREITVRQAGTGAVCPPLVDTDPCNTHDCPVDCVVSNWSAFEECTTSCGGGSKTRTRTVTTEPCCLGAPCPSLVDIQRCNEDACPITTETYDPCDDLKENDLTTYNEIKRVCDNTFTAGSQDHTKCMLDSCITGTVIVVKPDCLTERLKAATVPGYEIDPKCLEDNCPNECSGNGSCQADNTCLCDAGFVGKDCSTEHEYGCFEASSPGGTAPIDPVKLTKDNSQQPLKTSALAAEVPTLLRAAQVQDSMVVSLAETLGEDGVPAYHLFIVNNNGNGNPQGGSYTLSISGLESATAANFVTSAEGGAAISAGPTNNAGVWEMTFEWPAAGRCGVAITNLPATFSGDFTISNTRNVLQVLIGSAHGQNKANGLLAVYRYTKETFTVSGGSCLNDCESITSCHDCARAAQCGWCIENDSCMPGDASGPHYYGSCANWRFNFDSQVSRRLTQEYAAPVSPGFTDVILSEVPQPGTILPLEVTVDIDNPEKIQWDLAVLAEYDTASKATWKNKLVSFLKAMTGFPNIGVSLNKHSEDNKGFEIIKKLSNPRDFHFIGVHVNRAAVNFNDAHNVVAGLINLATTEANPVGWRQGARKVIMVTSDKPMVNYFENDVDEARAALLARDIIPAFVVSKQLMGEYQALADAIGFGFVLELQTASDNIVEATVRTLRLAAGHAATFYAKGSEGHLDTAAWDEHSASFSMFGLTDRHQARFPIPVHADNSEIQETQLHMPAFGSARIENVASDRPTALAIPERSSGLEGGVQIVELKGMSWRNLVQVVPRISVFPTQGTLHQVVTVNGAAVAGDVIPQTSGYVSDALGRVAYVAPKTGYGRAFDSFSFKIGDGCIESDEVTVVLDVANVNNPPRAEIVAPVDEEDTANVITVTGFDDDNDAYDVFITQLLHELNEDGTMKTDGNVGHLYQYDQNIVNNREDAAAFGEEITEPGTKLVDPEKRMIYWPPLHANSYADFGKTPELLVKPCFDYKIVETETVEKFESNVAAVPIDVLSVNDAPFVFGDDDTDYTLIREWTTPDPSFCWKDCTFDEDFGEKYPWDAHYEYLYMGGGDIELDLLTFEITEIQCDEQAVIQTDLLGDANIQVGDIMTVNEPGLLHPIIRFRPGPDRNNDLGGFGDYYCKISYKVIDVHGDESQKTNTITISINPLNDPPRLRGGEEVVTALERTEKLFSLNADDPEGRGFRTYIKSCHYNDKGTFEACLNEACDQRQTIDCAAIPDGGLALDTHVDASGPDYNIAFTSGGIQSLSEGLDYNFIVVAFADENDAGKDDDFYVNINVVAINDAPVITVDGVEDNGDGLSYVVMPGALWSSEIVVDDIDIEDALMKVTITVDAEDESKLAMDESLVAEVDAEQTSDKKILVYGTLAQINEALATLTFEPADVLTQYTILIEADDQGYFGQCPPADGEELAWDSSSYCALTDTATIVVEARDQTLIDASIVAGAGVGVLGLAVLGAVAATRFANQKGMNPEYAPWDDFEADGAAVANPLYEQAGVEGSNALYQAGDTPYTNLDNSSYL